MEGLAKAENNKKPLDVFEDFKARYVAILKALTTDVEEFFEQCDPEKENLCLYGLPNERWAVNPPAEELPTDFPEPVLGINFARDGMHRKEWLSFVANHSDAWLLAVAFYAGARLRFSKADRNKLFDMINDLPTIQEVVTGVTKTQQKEELSVSNESKNKSKPNISKKASESQEKFTKLQQKYKEEEDDEQEEEGWDTEKDDEEEQDETLCGACAEKYAKNQFWICCDNCETWFHGKCVKITAAKAEFIKQYKCPSCSKKRSRT